MSLRSRALHARVRMRVYVHTCGVLTMGSPVGALIRCVCGGRTVGIFRAQRKRGRGRESGRRGEGVASGLGSIVASRRYYLLYTRCLCRRADTVDSRLKSRIFVLAPLSRLALLPLSISLSLPPFFPSVGAHRGNCRERRTERQRAGPAIATDRSLHLSKLHAAHLHPEPMNSLSTITS